MTAYAISDIQHANVIRRAELLGMKAYWDDATLRDNPYTVTDFQQAWAKGWQREYDDQRDCRDEADYYHQHG